MGRHGDNLKRNLARELERRAQNAQARPVRPKPVEVQHVDDFDATPERLAMEPDAKFEEVKHEGFGRRIGKARRFTSSALTRIDKHLTPRQIQAGEWYQDEYQRCHFALSVVAAYGERIGGGDPTSCLPRTEAQLQARKNLHAARSVWEQPARNLMDKLLLDDELPVIRGRARQRYIEWVAVRLELLAKHRDDTRTKPVRTVNISLASCGTFE